MAPSPQWKGRECVLTEWFPGPGAAPRGRSCCWARLGGYPSPLWAPLLKSTPSRSSWAAAARGCRLRRLEWSHSREPGHLVGSTSGPGWVLLLPARPVHRGYMFRKLSQKEIQWKWAMKLGHPGEIIFTEETLETNSHQCNNPGVGAHGWGLSPVPSSSGSCLPPWGLHAANMGVHRRRSQLYLPPQKDEWRLGKAESRNERGNEKLFKNAPCW